MKVRNHRKLEWRFFKSDISKLKNRSYTFKYKSDLIRFLNKNFNESINGTVSLYEQSFGSSSTRREWCVWYNRDQYLSGSTLKVELRQLNNRGKKMFLKKQNISKESKKYFAFSERVITLMCHLKKEDGTIEPKDAKRLVDLYYKRGFKDFNLTDEDKDYINYYLDKGIDFYHWSDRCNWLRTKTVIEYFKKENLI